MSDPGTADASPRQRGDRAEPGRRRARRRPAARPDAGPEPSRYTLGERVTDAATAIRYERSPADPVYRPLKIYTIDPARRQQEGEVALDQRALTSPSSQARSGCVSKSCRRIGPLGKYDPVNLEDPRLLILNGHDPAPTDPIFHHQMLYAVAMSTYAVFRTALGREVSWGFGNAPRVGAPCDRGGECPLRARTPGA